MRVIDVLASVLALGLCGCGGGQVAAKVGGSSPQDVADQLRAAVGRDDFGAVVNLMPPTERVGTVAMLGLMPDVMRMMKPMIAMIASMGDGMAEGADEDAAAASAEEASKKMMADLDKLIVEMDGICKKHKVDLPSMEELGIDMMGGEPDPKEVAEKVGDRLDGVNQGAFVAEMMKAFAKFEAMMPEGSGSSGMFGDLAARVGDGKLQALEVTGDKATATLAGAPVAFVMIDGRWYGTDLSKQARLRGR